MLVVQIIISAILVILGYCASILPNQRYQKFLFVPIAICAVLGGCASYYLELKSAAAEKQRDNTTDQNFDSMINKAVLL